MRPPSGTADIHVLCIILTSMTVVLLNALFSEEVQPGQLRIGKSDSAINLLCDFKPDYLNSQCLSLFICKIGIIKLLSPWIVL